MTDATKPDDVTALMERCRAMIRRITADDAHIDNIIAAFEDTADALERLAADSERLTRERDEARAILAAADKGTPIYRAVERVLDDHSAWIADPREDVTKAIALAAGVAWMSAEKVDPNLEEMDRALAAARAEKDRLREALRKMDHAANEWADAATNAPVMLANVRDGIAGPDEYIKGLAEQIDHCRSVWSDARTALEQGERK